MGQGVAAGLPPLFAENLLVSQMKTECPAGAFANRGAAPVPHPSSHSNKKIESEDGKVFFIIDFAAMCSYSLS